MIKDNKIFIKLLLFYVLVFNISSCKIEKKSCFQSFYKRLDKLVPNDSLIKFKNNTIDSKGETVNIVKPYVIKEFNKLDKNSEILKCLDSLNLIHSDWQITYLSIDYYYYSIGKYKQTILKQKECADIMRYQEKEKTIKQDLQWKKIGADHYQKYNIGDSISFYIPFDTLFNDNMGHDSSSSNRSYSGCLIYAFHNNYINDSSKLMKVSGVIKNKYIEDYCTTEKIFELEIYYFDGKKYFCIDGRKFKKGDHWLFDVGNYARNICKNC